MATTKKAPAKKKAAAKGDADAPNIIILRQEVVPVKSLSMYHKNPRVGNVEKIAESLATNGQYRPLVVNIGTHTGRENEVAAGNHTLLGARRLGWSMISASFIDVDEDTLRKIVLVDNKAAEDGTYDDLILAELLKEIPDMVGTGYSDIEVSDIVAQAQAQAEQAMAQSARAVDLDAIKNSMPTFMGDVPKKDDRVRVIEEESEEERDAAIARGASRPNFDGDTDIQDVEAQPGGPSPEEVQAQLQGILEAREDLFFEGDNFFQIPDLREDMLVMDFPKNIQTWAGRDATPDDGEKWFFYNYGLGGTKGLPLDRTILAFNTYDDKFLNWWETPAYYTARMIAGGLRNAVVPDFSFYHTVPRFRHLEGVFQAQWLGRFMQEAGIRIIPRVQFDNEQSLQFNMLGIPKNPPYLHCSLQNTRDDMGKKEEAEARQAAILQSCVDALEPTRGLIVYGGNPARRMLDRIDTHGADPIWIENYAAVRRGTVFDKKDGLAKLSPKKRKELREKAIAEEAARMGVEPEQLKKKSRLRKADIPEDDDE